MHGWKSALSTAFCLGPLYAASPSNYATVVSVDRPVVYYHLGETSGTTAVDSSGNGHNGTYIGGVTFGQPGPLFIDPATSVSLDGSTGYVDSGFNPFSLSASIEAWVRPATLSGNPNVSGQELLAGMSYSTQLTYGNPPGYARMWIRSVNNTWYPVQTASQLPLDTWTHVVGTWSEVTKRLSIYVNGVLSAAVSGPGLTPSPGESFDVGSFGTVAMEYLQGGIAEVAYYDHALPAGRILAHYNAGRGANAVDLQGYLGSVSSTQWNQMVSSNVQYAVVNTWLGTAVNPNAAANLSGACQAQLGTAASMTLGLTPSALAKHSGAAQAQLALSQLDGYPTQNLGFMAVTVKYSPACEATSANPTNPTSPGCYPQDPVSVAARKTAIAAAIWAIRNGGISNVVVNTPNPPVGSLTNPNPQGGAWRVIAGGDAAFAAAGVPLWDAFASGNPVVIPNLGANCSIFSCSPFPGYGGWVSRVGEQYLVGDTGAFGIPVDLDAFASSLFPSSPPASCQ
jgi:hypothetical protein